MYYVVRGIAAVQVIFYYCRFLLLFLMSSRNFVNHADFNRVDMDGRMCTYIS